MEWRWGAASRLIFADGVALAGATLGATRPSQFAVARHYQTDGTTIRSPRPTIFRFEDVRRVFAARQKRAFSRAAFARCDP